MILITAAEKTIISEKCPNVYIARTKKGDSKRHHYYMEEQREAMKQIRNLRKQNRRKEMQRH